MSKFKVGDKVVCTNGSKYSYVVNGGTYTVGEIGCQGNKMELIGTLSSSYNNGTYYTEDFELVEKTLKGILKPCQRVKTRNGDMYIVCVGDSGNLFLANKEGWLNTNSSDDDHEIVEVFSAPASAAWRKLIVAEMDGKLFLTGSDIWGSIDSECQENYIVEVFEETTLKHEYLNPQVHGKSIWKETTPETAQQKAVRELEESIKESQKKLGDLKRSL